MDKYQNAILNYAKLNAKLKQIKRLLGNLPICSDLIEEEVDKDIFKLSNIETTCLERKWKETKYGSTVKAKSIMLCTSCSSAQKLVHYRFKLQRKFGRAKATITNMGNKLLEQQNANVDG